MATAALPVFMLGSFVGTLVDRYNKKSCMLVGAGIQLLLVAIAAGLFYEDMLSFPRLVAIGFCLSCFFPQFENSVSASVAKLVDEEHLAGATTTQSSRIELANIIAAVLSTSIIAAAGILYAIYINVALYAIGILFIWLIEVDLLPEMHTAAKGKEDYFQELKAGINYIWSSKGMRWYSVIFAFESFFILPIILAIPILVKNVLQEAVSWVAVLETSLSIGAVGMTLLMSFKQRYRNYYKTHALGLFISGLAMIATGLSGNKYAVAAAIFFVGAMSAALLAMSFVLYQYSVPQEIKGRFLGIMSTILAGMYPISYLLVGILSDWFPIKTVIVFCGIGLILLIPPLLLMPQIRQHIGYDEKRQDGLSP